MLYSTYISINLINPVLYGEYPVLRCYNRRFTVRYFFATPCFRSFELKNTLNFFNIYYCYTLEIGDYRDIRRFS